MYTYRTSLQFLGCNFKFMRLHPSSHHTLPDLLRLGNRARVSHRLPISTERVMPCGWGSKSTANDSLVSNCLGPYWGRPHSTLVFWCQIASPFQLLLMPLLLVNVLLPCLVEWLWWPPFLIFGNKIGYCSRDWLSFWRYQMGLHSAAFCFPGHFSFHMSRFPTATCWDDSGSWSACSWSPMSVTQFPSQVTLTFRKDRF